MCKTESPFNLSRTQRNIIISQALFAQSDSIQSTIQRVSYLYTLLRQVSTDSRAEPSARETTTDGLYGTFHGDYSARTFRGDIQVIRDSSSRHFEHAVRYQFIQKDSAKRWEKCARRTAKVRRKMFIHYIHANRYNKLSAVTLYHSKQRSTLSDMSNSMHNCSNAINCMSLSSPCPILSHSSKVSGSTSAISKRKRDITLHLNYIYIHLPT